MVEMREKRKVIFSLIVLWGIVLIWPKKIGAQEEIAKYVRGEVVVRYRAAQTPADLRRLVTIKEERGKTADGQQQNLLEDANLKAVGQKTPEERLSAIETVEKGVGVIGVEDIDSAIETKRFVLYQTDGRKSVEETVNDFRGLTEVEFAEPNWILSTQAVTPNDPEFSNMWALGKISAGKVWNLTKGSNSVEVAVIDDGIDKTHEDFVGRQLVSGYDFTKCGKWVCDSLGGCECAIPKARDSDPSEEGDGGHGTHVTGIIGAVTNNQKGVSGLNWQVKIMPLRALSLGGRGTIVDIADAIKYAADHGAKVINMSLGGEQVCMSGSLEQARIDYAYEKGVTVVVAAGNSNRDSSVFSPASCNHVIAVAATRNDDRRAFYSNYGPKVDLAAPGGESQMGGTAGCTKEKCILSTSWSASTYPLFKGKKYAAIQGTSMAAPHVAGAAALVLAINPRLTPDQVESILKSPSNTDPLTTETGKPIGKRLNVYKAVLAAANRATPTITRTPVATNTPRATSTPSPSCPAGRPAKNQGNANCDTMINDEDFNLWLSQFHGTPNPANSADFNNDNKVDGIDFEYWRRGKFSSQ